MSEFAPLQETAFHTLVCFHITSGVNANFTKNTKISTLLVSNNSKGSLQGSPLVTTMLVRTNLDVTTKFWGSKKDQMRVCYSKMHGCNDIPLVRTIFSRDERSRYKRASLYYKILNLNFPDIHEKEHILYCRKWDLNRGPQYTPFCPTCQTACLKKIRGRRRPENRAHAAHLLLGYISGGIPS